MTKHWPVSINEATSTQTKIIAQTSCNITTNHMIANYLYSHRVWIVVK